MKSVLISLLLLAPAFICLVNGAQFTRGFCLQLINNGKSEFAEKYNVANMNGLSYDKKLEKKILEQLSFTNGCPQPSIISHNGFDIYLNINNEDSVIDLLSGVGKTTMACIKTKCEENGKEFISIVTDYSDIPATSGAPGSQCSDGRTVNSDGLCIRENHRNGYERKFLDTMGGILKEAAEKTGKIGIGIGQTINDGTTALGKKLGKTLGDSETTVVHETRVVSKGKASASKKTFGDIISEANKKLSEMAVEPVGQSDRKYVRKVYKTPIWSDVRTYTSPPFFPYPEYQKKEDDEHVQNEEPFWPNHPLPDPIIWN